MNLHKQRVTEMNLHKQRVTRRSEDIVIIVDFVKGEQLLDKPGPVTSICCPLTAICQYMDCHHHHDWLKVPLFHLFE